MIHYVIVACLLGGILMIWRPEPTEDELVATLIDPNTAGAVMLVSPEVASSPIIRNVEALWIFRRHRAKDWFIVKPVLIGLDYVEANTVLDTPAGFQDLRHWNLHKLSTDVVTEDDARTIARDVVRTRPESDRGGYPRGTSRCRLV